MRPLLFAVLIAGLLAGCGRQPAAAPQPEAAGPPVLKVAVSVDGSLTVDGEPSSLPELRKSLEQHKEKQGATVWYYRENGDQEPPEIVSQIFETVMIAGLPIRMSSRPDYSDSIDENGVPIPVPVR